MNPPWPQFPDMSVLTPETNSHKDVVLFRINEQKKAQPEIKTYQIHKKIQPSVTRTNQKVAFIHT